MGSGDPAPPGFGPLTPGTTGIRHRWGLALCRVAPPGSGDPAPLGFGSLTSGSAWRSALRQRRGPARPRVPASVCPSASRRVPTTAASLHRPCSSVSPPSRVSPRVMCYCFPTLTCVPLRPHVICVPPSLCPHPHACPSPHPHVIRVPLCPHPRVCPSVSPRHPCSCVPTLTSPSASPRHPCPPVPASPPSRVSLPASPFLPAPPRHPPRPRPARTRPPHACHTPPHAMAPSGPPERGPLAQLARDTACPACGQPLRDPVLFACNHSCCRRCLPAAGPAPPPAPAPRCPRCRLPCAPRRLRTPVALAVESRIAQRLARGGPPPPPRHPQRCRLGAQLRADAAPPRPPSPKEGEGSPPEDAPSPR